MDEEETLSNLCGDLVSLKRLEPALVHLFRERQPGSWVTVRELDARAGYPNESIQGGLCATWLTTPSADPGEAVIFFLDPESFWSTKAWYNVAHLMDRHPRASVADG
jgi:hypothetical protein